MPRVTVASVRKPGQTLRVTPLMADILVKRGLFRHMDQEAESDAVEEAPRKKRAYRRRDMKAEA